MAKIQERTQVQAQVVTHSHPTMRTFIHVGLVLFAITAIEFGIVYIEGIRTTIVAILFLLSIVKFWLVGAYFMHLKFESKLLTWAFVVGLVLATLITIAQKYVNLA